MYPSKEGTQKNTNNFLIEILITLLTQASCSERPCRDLNFNIKKKTFSIDHNVLCQMRFTRVTPLDFLFDVFTKKNL